MGYTWRQFDGYRHAAARRLARQQQDAMTLALATTSARGAAALRRALGGAD